MSDRSSVRILAVSLILLLVLACVILSFRDSWGTSEISSNKVSQRSKAKATMQGRAVLGPVEILRARSTIESHRQNAWLWSSTVDNLHTQIPALRRDCADDRVAVFKLAIAVADLATADLADAILILKEESNNSLWREVIGAATYIDVSLGEEILEEMPDELRSSGIEIYARTLARMNWTLALDWVSEHARGQSVILEHIYCDAAFAIGSRGDFMDYCSLLKSASTKRQTYSAMSGTRELAREFDVSIVPYIKSELQQETARIFLCELINHRIRLDAEFLLDPELDPRILEGLGKADISRISINLGETLARRNPRAAVDSILKLPDGQIDAPKAIGAAIHKWLSFDPMAAGLYVKELPLGPIQDEAIKSVVEYLRGVGAVEDAEQWEEALGSP